MTLLLLLISCGPGPFACRAPNIEVWTVEGEEAALCDFTFSACDDESIVTVSCSNDTFEGDYACTWIRIVGTRSVAGDFSSPDICTLDEDGMIAEIEKEAGMGLSVE